MTATIEIEVSELEKAKDELDEAIAKLYRIYSHSDRTSEDSDLLLLVINILENVRDIYLGAWLEEFRMAAHNEKLKLEAWELWARQ